MTPGSSLFWEGLFGFRAGVHLSELSCMWLFERVDW